MINILYYTHTGTRWLVMLSLLIAFGFMVYSLMTNREQDRITRIVMVVFSSLVGLQWVVGIFYYLLYGNLINNFARPDWTSHLITMTVALVVAHMYLPFRRRASTRNYYIAAVVVLVVTVLLIIFGVSFLTDGGRWSFQPMNPPPQL